LLLVGVGVDCQAAEAAVRGDLEPLLDLRLPQELLTQLPLVLVGLRQIALLAMTVEMVTILCLVA
jgi:hypothetical protein